MPLLQNTIATMTYDAWIIDGYVDEPTCLGVPPYISPYVRTVAGVLYEHGYNPGYCTIDQIRTDTRYLREMNQASLAVCIAGMTVPGTYLGGTPASLLEISQIAQALTHPTTCLSGPILFGAAQAGGNLATPIDTENTGCDIHLPGSPAESLHEHLSGTEPTGKFSYQLQDQFAYKGSKIITKHPSFPNIIAEIETARGCERYESGGCSFCTERFYGAPIYRDVQAILAEVSALSQAGCIHFRVGRQPDILAYQTTGQNKPNLDALEQLFSGIRTHANTLKTLHIDNVNPGTITAHKEISKEALEIIIKYHTPGDTAAFGLESADPAVISANNLSVMPDEVLDAIEIVTEIGGKRTDGICELLSGLNFVCGLAGETKETYIKNKEFLKEIQKRKLLIRRVNIRQVMPFPGTKSYVEHTLGQHKEAFIAFKEWTRTEFDTPMLAQVFPIGTILHDLIIEKEGTLSFGRQIGSYPLLCGIPLQMKERTTCSVVIIGHGKRSVTALPYPIPINTLPLSALRHIPGLGKKTISKFFAKRPKNAEEFTAIIGPSPLATLCEYHY